MKSFADGIGHHRLDSYKQMVDALDRKLNEALTGLGMPANERRMVRNRSSKPLQAGIGKLAADEVPFDTDQAWVGLKAQQEFSISLWALARSCFVSVYYAYEDFVRSCIAVALNRPDYRINRFDHTGRDIESCLGGAVMEGCWMQPDVDIARRVRNAIVHNGSRRTRDLDQVKHDFEFVDGEIVILASHVRRLFKQLSPKASILAGKTMEKIRDQGSTPGNMQLNQAQP